VILLLRWFRGVGMGKRREGEEWVSFSYYPFSLERGLGVQHPGIIGSYYISEEVDI